MTLHLTMNLQDPTLFVKLKYWMEKAFKEGNWFQLIQQVVREPRIARVMTKLDELRAQKLIKGDKN